MSNHKKLIKALYARIYDLDINNYECTIENFINPNHNSEVMLSNAIEYLDDTTNIFDPNVIEFAIKPMLKSYLCDIDYKNDTQDIDQYFQVMNDEVSEIIINAKNYGKV